MSNVDKLSLQSALLGIIGRFMHQSQALAMDTHARETGVMQGLEKHNLTRITDASAAFLIQLQRNFVRAFLVECSFDTH